MRIVRMAVLGILGVITILAGFIMLFTPGPGLLVLFLGIWILSTAKIPVISVWFEKISVRLKSLAKRAKIKK